MDNEQVNDTVAVWLPEDFEPVPDEWDDDEALQDIADNLAHLVWPNMQGV